jgi:hypothetical protein
MSNGCCRFSSCTARNAVLQMMKAGERRLLEQQVATELGMDIDEVLSLSRPLKMALWEAGVPAMLKAGFKLPKGMPGSDDASGSPSSSSDGSRSSGGADAEADRRTSSKHASSSGRNFGPYFHRQYVFVAATMPAMTKSDVGTELQKRHKNAVWISGDLLHKSRPEVRAVQQCHHGLLGILAWSSGSLTGCAQDLLVELVSTNGIVISIGRVPSGEVEVEVFLPLLCNMWCRLV